MYNQKILIGICSLFMLSSCMTSKPVAPTLPELLYDFPPKPKLIQYTNPPVIEKNGENYVVTSELVTNATLLTDYYKRLETWKDLKNVR